MNFTEMKIALPLLMKHRVVPFIWGAQGVGKTQGVKQVVEASGQGFVHLHLATQEVGDLVGLLIPSPDGTVRHSRPSWFPTEGEGVVYLDELNRATPDVLQALFSFVTEGTIHTHKLPEGWRVVAAGNYQTSMFNVTDTSDSAWMSRFCHLDFQPTKEEFVVFAESMEAYGVADFIRTHGELLEVTHKERLNMAMITPDRRSWMDMVARLENEPELEAMRYEIYSGIVGATAAASFLSHKKIAHDKLSGRDVLNRFESVRGKIMEAGDVKNTRFDLLSGAADEILAMLPDKELTDTQMANFQSFLLTIPAELSLKVVNSLHTCTWKQKNKVLNNVEFAAKFKAKLK